jgi:uncharacterized Tic20 family protein
MPRDVEIEPLSSDERNMGMLCHLLSFLTCIGIPSFVGPLVIWLTKKDESAFIDENGKESLNFQISICIYCMLCVPLIFFIIGFFMIAGLAILDMICVVLASIAASEGRVYRYPLSIRLFK